MTDISTFSTFAARFHDFIRSAGVPPAKSSPHETQFNQLALSLFALQFSHNAPYRCFCESRKMAPQKISDWREIPAMPTVGFKELELTSLPLTERTHIFHSSGTTTQTPSRHFHSRDSLSIYEAALAAWFRPHFPNAQSTCLLSLTPPASEAPHSSLVHMFDTIGREFSDAQLHFVGKVNDDGVWELDLPKMIEAFQNAMATNRPVTILGSAFNFVHLLDHLAEAEQKFQLPSGSCVLETGGYKSRSRAMPKRELHALIGNFLGVPETHIVCEYGMSELSSQAYDGIAGIKSENNPSRATYLPLLGERVGVRADVPERIFHFPPWARAQIINPETGREAGESETGLIRIFDLANVYSVMAVQTEDLGVRRGDGFELLGRAVEVEARGCSLMSV